MQALENFYLRLPENVGSCLLALRVQIKNNYPQLDEVYRYGSPFFKREGQSIFYFWIDKKSGHPYLGFLQGFRMQHPSLISGKRTQVKIFEINPDQDLPLELIFQIVDEALELS